MKSCLKSTCQSSPDLHVCPSIPVKRLVYEADHKALDDNSQKVVVQLFSELSDAHDNLSKVAKSISKLGKITSLEKFGFILKLAIRPLIQLKILPNLCSPGDLWFSSERLTQEEYFQEMCINEILPKPYHNKFSKVPIKHVTYCLATATHYLLRKCMFDLKVAKEFAVAEKKLHLAISGRKYDLGKKPPKPKPHVKPTTKKKKSAKPGEPKMDERAKIPEDKQPSPEDSDQPQSDDVDDDDDNLLPDPFSPQEKKPKMSGTKEDQGAEDTQETQEMDTMPECISSDNNDAPLKSFDTKNPAGIPKTSHHQPKTFTMKNPPSHRPCNK